MNSTMGKVLENKPQQIIALDFDGVIHSYTSGWQGLTIIPDKPVKSVRWAISLLRKNNYKILIYSTRCATHQGRKAIKNWLKKWDIKIDGIVTDKPPCLCIVDDRAIQFSGNWNQTFNDIITFKNYIEREKKTNEDMKTVNQLRKANGFPPLKNEVNYIKENKNE